MWLRVVMVAFVLAFVLSPSGQRARADALEPPPTDCPEGSIGSSSRRGGRCELAGCEGGCLGNGFGGPPLVCSGGEIALCVDTVHYPAETVQLGPRTMDYPEETWNVVVGPCASDGSCARGRCVRQRACVPESSPRAHGGLCAASPARQAGGGEVAALAVLGALVLARRRRGVGGESRRDR
jgi:hypothetical protein